MQSVAFDAPGADGSCVAYVRLAPPPLTWLKVEASAEVHAPAQQGCMGVARPVRMPTRSCQSSTPGLQD